MCNISSRDLNTFAWTRIQIFSPIQFCTFLFFSNNPTAIIQYGKYGGSLCCLRMLWYVNGLALWLEDGHSNCQETAYGSLCSFSRFAHRNRDELFAFSISAKENPALMLLSLQQRWLKSLLTHSISARRLICGQHASKRLCDMMWLFICKPLESQRYSLCLLPSCSSVCLPVFFFFFSQPTGCNFSSEEIVPLSFSNVAEHISVISWDQEVFNKKSPYHLVTLALCCKAP